MNRNFKQVLVGGAVLVGAVGSGLARATATPIDVTAVTDQIAAVATPTAAIGAAVLLVFVGIKTFKWVRRAM